MKSTAPKIRLLSILNTIIIDISEKPATDYKYAAFARNYTKPLPTPIKRLRNTDIQSARGLMPRSL
jgi:hypothetical protein